MAKGGSFKQTSSGELREGAPSVPAAPSADYGLLASIGAELAGPIATMQYVVQEYARKRSLTDKHVRLLHGAVEGARKVAIQSQDLARIAQGKMRQSHERLKLDEILKTALAEHAKEFQGRGVELIQHIRPIEIIVDPGLLVALLDAAIAWALTLGQKLAVTLDMKNWPPHGILLFKSSHSIAAGNGKDEQPDTDSLSWHLLRQLAMAMGLSADRIKSEGGVTLMLEFPRTVQQMEGLTAIEVDTGFDTLHTDSRALAGTRILIVTDDERLRQDIKAIARTMSLDVDMAHSSAQAVRACELDLPHMIVIDERTRNQDFDELRQDLLRTNPNFPFIEIAVAPNVLEMASWMTESMARVSRDSIRDQLPSILALELAKTM